VLRAQPCPVRELGSCTGWPGWQEFLARYCELPGARLELRSGAAAEHLVKVAGTEQADMIALAWSQRLEPGRALVVRRAILDTGVPVLLVPMPAN